MDDPLLMNGLRHLDSASAPVPVRDYGLTLFADLEHAGFMPPILHGVIREGRWPFSATGSGSLRPQVGTAFPPKRNFIVTPRFATYKVGVGDAVRSCQLVSRMSLFRRHNV